MPDPEVPERPVRRRSTAEYKLRIVEEANALSEPGAVGALLRREGLYSSHLVDWRRQYRLGALSSLAWRSCSPISASPRATADPTRATTTRTPRPSSRRSSTAQASRPASARSDARSFCRRFFTWYNEEHRHVGIGLLTPATVHAGRAPEVRAARAITLDAAYAAHPERFVRRPPTPPELPTAVWINKPIEKEVPTQ
ncbi:MAG: hypothetical protein C4343_01520 [Chloroflexota bacterium]